VVFNISYFDLLKKMLYGEGKEVTVAKSYPVKLEVCNNIVK